MTTPAGPICVLGFPRSGTSLTMRILNLLGVKLGPDEDLVPPTEAENPLGYWEPRWMLDINDEILAALGAVWWHPLKVEQGWERGPELDALRERAQTLVQRKFAGLALWGWKEPRTSLTLPFWQQLIPDARYVICVRNPVDAISSLQRRPEPTLPIVAWSELWLEYMGRIFDATRDSERIVVFYEDYFRDHDHQITRLASFIGLDLSGEDDRRSLAAAAIEPHMRHHLTSPLELASAWGIVPASRVLFLALLAAHPLREVRDDDVGEAIERVASELFFEQRMLAIHRDAASERLELVDRLEEVARERLELIEELDNVAAERLLAIEALTARVDDLEACLAHSNDRRREPIGDNKH